MPPPEVGRSPCARATSPWEDDPDDEGHGLISFALEGGAVYHVYSSYGRGTDVFNTFYQLLDRAQGARRESPAAGRGRVVVAPARRYEEG